MVQRFYTTTILLVNPLKEFWKCVFLDGTLSPAYPYLNNRVEAKSHLKGVKANAEVLLGVRVREAK